MTNLKEKTKYKNLQKGQSLVEFMILSLALISLIKGTLFLFWIVISLLWMEHQLYQGLVCAAQQKNLKACEAIALQEIKKLNPLGVIKSLKIRNLQKIWKGEILWSFYKKDFVIRQSLSLPH